MACGELVSEPDPSRSGRKGWIEKPKKENLTYCQDNEDKEKFQEKSPSPPYFPSDRLSFFMPRQFTSLLLDLALRGRLLQWSRR